jgi:POT family proton-dependent oligopeptide transporter
MVIGLAIFLYGRRYLPAPRAAQGKTPRAPWAPGDTGRLLALGLLVPVMAVALLLNQEIFNAYLVWADREFEFTFFAIRIPTSYLVGIDAAFAFTTLVGVAAFWQWWGKRHREPDELAKMVIGSAFSTLGGLCLVMAGATQGHGKIGLFWPLMFHLLNSIGFSHVLPVSLALFSRLAPKAIEGTAIGIYYLAFFLANALVGKVGGWLEVMPITQFWGLHAGACAVGLVFFWLFRQFLAPRLIGESG